MAEWEKFRLRLVGVASDWLRASEATVCAVQTHVVLQSGGCPVLWTEPRGAAASIPTREYPLGWSVFVSQYSAQARKALRNSGTNGICVASVTVYVNHYDEAMDWERPILHRIEPASGAEDFIRSIFSHELLT